MSSQGRSVGVCVVGALQDPRKDVISLRNLFSTRIALRLDESDQVDMVLGDGARDRGALADPWTVAGVGYIRLEASPDPVRVRAAYVTDTDIIARAIRGSGASCSRCPSRRRSPGCSSRWTRGSARTRASGTCVAEARADGNAPPAHRLAGCPAAWAA